MRKQFNISKTQMQYYIHCKRTVDDIAKMSGWSISTIRNYIKKYSLEEYHECRYCRESDFYELKSQYQNDALVVFNLCQTCDILHKKSQALAVNKVEMQRNRFKTLAINKNVCIPDKGYLSKDVFYHEYIVNKKTLYELRNMWECSERTILKYLKLYSFKEYYLCEKCGSHKNLFPKKEKGMFKYRKLCKKCTSTSYSNAQKQRQAVLDFDKNLSKDLIEDLHFNKKLNKNQICEQLRIGSKKFNSLLKKYNIKEIKYCEKCGTTHNMHKSHSSKGKIIVFNFCEQCFSKMTRGIKDNFSKISQELFWAIYGNLPRKYKKECYFAELNAEYSDKVDYIYREYFDVSNYTYRYDFCIIYRGFKFVIEFNGDIFHANPQLFLENDCPSPFYKTLTSKQIWDKDDKRENYIQSTGGYLLTIWENDYKLHKKACVNFCLKRIDHVLSLIPKDFKEQFNQFF